MGATTKSRKTVQPLKEYRPEAKRVIQQCIDSGEPFTVDTVRMKMSADVKDVHHNVLPSLISQRAIVGDIVAIGYVRSPNKSRRSGKNTLWIKA